MDQIKPGCSPIATVHLLQIFVSSCNCSSSPKLWGVISSTKCWGVIRSTQLWVSSAVPNMRNVIRVSLSMTWNNLLLLVSLYQLSRKKEVVWKSVTTIVDYKPVTTIINWKLVTTIVDYCKLPTTIVDWKPVTSIVDWQPVSTTKDLSKFSVLNRRNKLPKCSLPNSKYSSK